MMKGEVKIEDLIFDIKTELDKLEKHYKEFSEEEQGELAEILIEVYKKIEEW